MSSEATTAEEAETQARTTRDAIVEAALPHVAFDGWTMKTVAAAAEDAGYRRETAERLFPGGVSDVLRHWSDLSVRRAVSHLALPHNTAIAVGNTLRTIDAIWYAAGDTATDFSYYSKRALLTPVYVASVLYWIDDESEDFADTWAFIGRRLDDILRIPRLTSGLRRLANPRSWFSGSRVGNDWEPRQPA
jgi:ubiquinone biosynthesis protein COQ9